MIHRILVLVLMVLPCIAPRLGRAEAWPAATAVAPETSMPHLADCGHGLLDDVQAAAITGAGWWSERKKRFQELVVCALSSANVTYLLLTGISGPGAVIGFSVSLLGVIVCL